MAPSKLHQQAIYLEPENAELLDQRSAETRNPKAALLSEAVDDRLTKHGKSNNAWYADIVSALRLGKTRARQGPIDIEA